MRVAIAGGGIGGLTAALSLHAAGIDVVVHEAVSELRPLGVGINLLPHASRELTELGLADRLSDTGVATHRLAYHDRFGNLVWDEPRGLAAEYRWPQYSIHRGELQVLLYEAVIDRLGADAVRLGSRLESFAERDGHVEIRTSTTTEHADALVGADGMHSRVREILHPGEGQPLWNGIRMYRGVTDCEPFLDGRTMIMAGSNLDVKLVAYPIGPRLVNWVVEVSGGRSAGVADWTRTVPVPEVVHHVRDWQFEWLDVSDLVAGAERAYQYPMVDRDPLPWWTRRHVTLLGDAAHPMYPIGSNGGTQAIIDARVLAWALARHPTVAEGLDAYEQLRRAQANDIVLANRQLGPERVMALVAERAPHGFERIEDILSQEERTAIADAYKATAGFAVDELNNRPSWDAGPA